MTDSRQEVIAEHFQRSLETVTTATADRDFLTATLAIADAITRTFRNGGKLLIAGNGGSAADAQHIAGEFLSRFRLERRPLAAIALTTDTSVLTAIGNDYGYDQVFVRQILGLGRPGDAFLAISTSGRSPNVLAALEVARSVPLITIGFSGRGNTAMHPLCDLTLSAPSNDTPLIQQIHIIAAHAICELVERDLFRDTRR